MGLYLSDEVGHLCDLGSATRYHLMIQRLDGYTKSPELQSFLDTGFTNSPIAVGKALMAEIPTSLSRFVADAAMKAKGFLAVRDENEDEDTEEEIFPDDSDDMRAAAKKPTRVDVTGFTFDKASETAKEFAHDHAAETIAGISKTTREEIREAVEAAFEEQFDVDELADRITDIIGDEARAETIARTETMRASNEGQMTAWDQAVEAGMLSEDAQMEWITTPDDKLCPVCEGLDGVRAAIGEPFEADGETYDSPPAHPNCRCTTGITEA